MPTMATRPRRGRGGGRPPASRNPSTGPSPVQHATCGVCSKEIVDGKEDALLCEGRCASWLHRCCAGITLRCHDELSKSSVPFVCYGCSLLTHRSEISRLESEIVSLKSVVAGLRSAINDTKDSSERASWSAVLKKRKTSGPSAKPGLVSAKDAPGKVGLIPSASLAGNSRPVEIDGVRKIWGTVKATTTSAVSNTLKRLTTVGSTLLVKRKFQAATNNGHKERWWFTVRGDEADLVRLQSQWESVANQTSWRLQRVSYSTPPPSSTPNTTLVHTSLASSAEVNMITNNRMLTSPILSSPIVVSSSYWSH